jgi:charged multivesicular body protein 1
MKQVTGSMAGVVKAMDSALASMNLEKVTAIMEKFERQFEDLDVQSQSMEEAMSSTTTLTVPAAQVDNLLQEVADEAGYLFSVDSVDLCASELPCLIVLS